MRVKGQWPVLATLGMLMLGFSNTTFALDKCSARVDAASATVQVSASRVGGDLWWGRAAGAETEGFTDAACVAKGKANCTLAETGTSNPLTHFEQCFLYLADDSSSCAVAIAGCGPSAAALYFDDFEGASHAWTPADTSTVTGNQVLGGHCSDAGPYTRHVALDAAHTGLNIRATIHHLDDWQSEMAYLKVDGQIVWTHDHEARNTHDALDVAGNPIYPDTLGVVISLDVPHTAATALLEFGSTLGADPCDASLAIDNVVISSH